MQKSADTGLIIEKLKRYKRKYYLQQLLKGSIIALTYCLATFLLFTWLEYSLRFNTPFRATLFFLYVVSAGYFLVRYIFIPIYRLITNSNHLTNERAAIEIGKYFPQIKDKLLNIIQLSNSNKQENSLILASIQQRSAELKPFNFQQSVQMKDAWKYGRYIIIPAVILLLVSFLSPDSLKEGSKRIIQYNTEFIPEAPFTFHVKNSSLQAFRSDQFVLEVSVEGDALPESIQIVKEGVRQTLQKKNQNTYTYAFNNLKQNVPFYLTAAGYNSKQYELNVVERPSLSNMTIKLQYPAYLNREGQRVANSGNLLIPEGTTATWLINGKNTEEIDYTSALDTASFVQEGAETFRFDKQLRNSTPYELTLHNEFGQNQKKIAYNIEVIKDQYPEINVAQVEDSTLFENIALAGSLSDDYGISRFMLHYTVEKDGATSKPFHVKLPLQTGALAHSFFEVWNIDSLKLTSGDKIRYYLSVWDNDGVNGSKQTKSSEFIFSIPSKKEIDKAIANSSQNTENQIDKNVKQVNELNEKLEKAEEVLKSKRQLDWEDRKLLEEILKQKQAINESIKKLQKQNQEATNQRERFDQLTEDEKKKSEQLQKLMEDLLKEENQELYDRLKELLEQNNDTDDFRELMDQMKKDERNTQKELERTMELFKRLQIQMKLSDLNRELQDSAQEQEKLADETKEQADQQKEGEENAEKQEALEQKQQELNEEFDKIKEEFDQLEKENQSLKQPTPLKDTKEQENDIDQAQMESLQQLQQNENQKASESQQNASEQMKKLSQQMASMQSGMQMEMLQENIDNLRDIVDNLLKLSFTQESLMKSFREVNQSDPRFIDLSEKQLNLQDDAVIIEDSLTALASRVFQIESFITREMGEMKASMQESIAALRDRNKDRAVGKQQFAMTAMNNLALLLDDVLEQMQMQMQSAMGMSNKPQSGNQQQPSMSDMQKAVNQQTQQLSQEQKQGRQLSEQLAKLAQEQARIRKMLKEMMENSDNPGQKGSGGNESLQQLLEDMEQNEEDLVNKNITPELLKRQQKMVTRLLEAEKAKEEQESEEERKGETATEYEKRIPNAFEEYIEQKKKEIELLKTVPPSFTPYYKKEINDFYERQKTLENNSENE